MTIVLLAAEDVFGRGAGGTVEARPWIGDSSHVVVDGEQVIFANPVSVTLRSGEPARPLDIDPTLGRYCIRWRLQSADGRSRLTRYTSIPDVPSIPFGDLVDVDPLTFEPDESTLPAWEAVLEDIQLASNSASASAQAAAGSASAASDSEQAAADSAERAETAAEEAGLLAAISVVVMPTETPDVVAITVPSHIVINDSTAVLLFATPEAS